MEAQAADIAFLANYAQTLPQADMTKVAAAGFSWGGMANVFAAARTARDGAFGDYQRADVLQAYRSGALYAHRFLDAYLKNDAKALEFLKQSPARHGIGPQVMSMESRPASFTLFGEADFLRAFAKAGYKDAQAILAKMAEQSPDFKLGAFHLNSAWATSCCEKKMRAAATAKGTFGDRNIASGRTHQLRYPDSSTNFTAKFLRCWRRPSSAPASTVFQGVFCEF